MFKKLIPVVALALIAGPVFAADSPPAAGADQSSTSTGSSKASHKHKHHKSHKSSSKTSGSSSSTDSAPAK
jgi:hypothetical protein